MSWTLQSPTATKSFDSWGLTDPTLELTSQSPDLCTFTHEGAPYDSTPLFPYLSRITIFRPDGIRWFTGVVIQTQRVGSPGAEGLRYRVAGPWWHLTKTVYQVISQFLASQHPTTIAGELWSRIILNMNNAGQRISPREQITLILQYAIAAGAPFQIGTIKLDVNLGAGLVDVQVPFREVRAITCAQAIREELRILPDAVCYFDYKTNPPTFHCVREAYLTPVAIDVSDGALVESHTVNPREDLVVPAVVIQYLQQTDVDGVTYNTPIIDIAPATATGQELGALVAAIDLKGAKVSSTKATVYAEDLTAIFTGSQAAQRAWLRRRLHWLDDRYVNLSLPSVPSVSDPTTDPVTPISLAAVLPHIITEGSVPEWFPYDFQVVRLKFDLIYDQYAGAIASPDANPVTIPTGALLTDQNYRHPVTLDVIMTNAPLGWQTYSQAESVDPAEPVPVGLAAYMYHALGTLTYEGDVSVIEEEVTGLISQGNSLNFTGGRPEWATMAAPIQSLSVDIAKGRTTARFGWPQQLGVQDLIEWLRALRPVQRQTATSEITTGISASDGEISFPRNQTRHDQTDGHGKGEIRQMNVGTEDAGAKLRMTGSDVQMSLSAYLLPAPLDQSGSHLTAGFLQFLPSGAPDPTTGVKTPNAIVRNNNQGEIDLRKPGQPSQAVEIRPEKIQFAGDYTDYAGGATVAEPTLQRSIRIAIQDAVDNMCNGLAITLREIDVCVDVGAGPTIWKMRVLCSAPYPPLPPNYVGVPCP